MNTFVYIESGIIELYISGEVSAQEKQEVECMSHIYPEIKAEITRLEIIVEQFATLHSKTPPTALKNKIFAELDALTEAENAPEILVHPNVENVEEEKKTEDSPIISLKTPNYWRYAAAACLFLLVGISGLYFSNTQKYDTQIAALQTQINENQKENAQLAEAVKVYQNPLYKKVELGGVKEKSPSSSATVFWNQESKEVRIIASNLPKPVADKQYQLWAIIDGKPVDMGMIPIGADTMTVIKMKPTTEGNAQAFAITLEKKGGVPSPTLSEMYVIGNI